MPVVVDVNEQPVAVKAPSDLLPKHRSMGYQPSLDGLRAMSVIAVIFYHAGFGWMPGGFFGVEVFFVVSGYLITSLLIEERHRDGKVNLGRFWQRRARRLLPALFTMMLVIGIWVSLRGSAEAQSQLRRDYPWSIFYVANWGQILGSVPYFQPGSPSPFRHLWSLAVEEQWYLLWPMVFVALMAWHTSLRTRGRLLVGASFAVMALTWWMARNPQLTPDRVNLLYLSSFTRGSGLLLGAGVAFLWRPWRGNGAPGPGAGKVLDAVGAVSVAVLAVAFTTIHLIDRLVYRWVLPVVTISSVLAVMVVVHPAAWSMRRIFGSRTMVEIGKRSYGLYLWTWPVMVLCEATRGSWPRFLLAMALAVPISEACYRFIETPIRTGGLSRWFAATRSRDWTITTWAGGLAAVALLVPLALFFTSVTPFDPAADASEVAFDPAAVDVSAASVPPEVDVSTPSVPPATDALAIAPVVTQPVLPRSVVVVGDSQAHSLAINLPQGIDGTFSISDGSVEGCSVYDDGKVVSARKGFSRSFEGCGGWSEKWASAASGAEVALVVLGAWDVFDVDVAGNRIAFGTPAADQRFLGDLQVGTDALKAAGARVALLEVPCMRPQDVKGAGVPALPERGDDARVAHLNDLLRQAAAADPEHVTFVAGPAEWCTNEAIATDLGYRWDGVHVYKPGAKLIYESIAAALLAIPVPAG